MNDNIPPHLRNLAMTDRHLRPLRPRRRNRRPHDETWLERLPSHHTWRAIFAALIIFWGGFFLGVFAYMPLDWLRGLLL